MADEVTTPEVADEVTTPEVTTPEVTTPEVTTPEVAPGIPGTEGAEGAGEHPAALAEAGVCPPIRSAGTESGPFVADVTVVEGAKSAVRTLARRLAGVADSEVTVPTSAEVSSQSVSPLGAQWVMSSDLTPGKIYFVVYDGIQLAYFLDAYVRVPGPEGRLTVPREHGYACGPAGSGMEGAQGARPCLT